MKKYKDLLGSTLALITAFALLITAGCLTSGFAGTSSSAAYETQLFSSGRTLRIDISIDESDWQDMLEHPLQEEYHAANVTINGTVLGNVAIRTKGNNSLTSVSGMDSDRYSFKIDFDYYVDNQNLYGLKKLNLNNNYSDSSCMREALSYQLMEEMGIPTPKYAYANITVNGELWGLYLAVEAIDETFLASNFENAYGDLYKPDGTGSDLVWISDDISAYTGLNLKTNEKTSDQSAILRFLDVINNEPEKAEEVMDVDEMLRYFAANTALANMDSYQGQMKHNYYLYEQDGIFSIIPWDYNMAFGGFGGGTIDIDAPVEGTTLEKRPLLAALLNNEEYKAIYEGYLREIAEGFLSKERLTAAIGQIAGQIAADVEADPTAFCTIEEFTKSISSDSTDHQNLIVIGAGMAESILSQLDGGEATFTISGGMGGGGKMDFRQGKNENSSNNRNENQTNDSADSKNPQMQAPPEMPEGNENTNQNQMPQSPDGNMGEPPQGFENGTMPDFGDMSGQPSQPPDTNQFGDSTENSDSANTKDNRKFPDGTIPAFGGMKGGGNPPEDGNAMGSGFPGRKEGNFSQPLNWSQILPVIIGSVSLLIIGLLFAIGFRRRKKIRQETFGSYLPQYFVPPVS